MSQMLKTEHKLSIKDKNDRPWAILTVLSRAQESSNTPRFVSSDRVEGTVQLDLLDRPKKIRRLTVELFGYVTEGGFITRHIGSELDGEVAEKSQRFLEKVEVLIPDGSQSPTSPTPSSGGFKLFKSKNGGDKAVALTGEHSFPFSIYLPPTITVNKGHFALRDQTYDLPPSFSQRGLEIYVNYELRIKAVVSSTLGSMEYGDKTSLHVHNTRLPPPIPDSFKQALEYEYTFPGPSQDPEGWWVSDHVASTINKDDGQSFVVTSKLAIPKPLCYTLRDAVPLRLSIKGDPNDLQYLSDGSAIRLCLVRNLSRDKKKPASENHNVDSDHENHLTCVKCPSVWPVESKDPEQLEFHAEVFLDQTLLTGFDFVKPSIAYHIMLLPYVLPSVKNVPKNPMIVQHIGVLGYRAAGSKPWKSFAPSDAITPAIPLRNGWYDIDNIGTLEMMLAS